MLIGATNWFRPDSKPRDACWLTPAQKQAIDAASSILTAGLMFFVRTKPRTQ